MKTNLTKVNLKIVNKSTASNWTKLHKNDLRMVIFKHCVQRSRHYLHLSKNAEKETRYIPGDPGEGTVPAPIMTPVVLLFLKTRWQVICDTDIWLTKSWWRPHNILSDEVYLTTRKPRFSSFLLAASIYHGKHDMNHKLWNIA